jgi:hypothetical protein
MVNSFYAYCTNVFGMMFVVDIYGRKAHNKNRGYWDQDSVLPSCEHHLDFELET